MRVKSRWRHPARCPPDPSPASARLVVPFADCTSRRGTGQPFGAVLGDLIGEQVARLDPGTFGHLVAALRLMYPPACVRTGQAADTSDRPDDRCAARTACPFEPALTATDPPPAASGRSWLARSQRVDALGHHARHVRGDVSTAWRFVPAPRPWSGRFVGHVQQRPHGVPCGAGRNRACAPCSWASRPPSILAEHRVVLVAAG